MLSVVFAPLLISRELSSWGATNTHPSQHMFICWWCKWNRLWKARMQILSNWQKHTHIQAYQRNKKCAHAHRHTILLWRATVYVCVFVARWNSALIRNWQSFCIANKLVRAANFNANFSKFFHMQTDTHIHAFTTCHSTSHQLEVHTNTHTHTCDWTQRRNCGAAISFQISFACEFFCANLLFPFMSWDFLLISPSPCSSTTKVHTLFLSDFPVFFFLKLFCTVFMSIIFVAVVAVVAHVNLVLPCASSKSVGNDFS